MIVVQRSRPIYDLGGRTRLFGSVSGNSRTSFSSRAESELPAPSRERGFPIGEKRGGWSSDRSGAGALASRGARAGGTGRVLLGSVAELRVVKEGPSESRDGFWARASRIWCLLSCVRPVTTMTVHGGVTTTDSWIKEPLVPAPPPSCI